MSEIIKLINVGFAYAGRPKLLSNINISIREGELVGIIGATGSGKTTLLHVMCSVIPHLIAGQLEGTVEIRGQDTRELSLASATQYIGVVGQDPENQLFNLVVKDEVAWTLENRGVDPSLIDSRVDAVLEFMQILHLKERITYDLSGGEKQRLVLAATYISEPDILFLDNPASMLDPVGSEMLMESLHHILETGQTVVMVEDKIDELVKYADRILVLDKGTIILDCPAAELGSHLDILRAASIRPPQQMSFSARLREELGLRIPISANGWSSASEFQSVLQPYLNSSDKPDSNYDQGEIDQQDFIRVEALSFTYPRPNRVEALREIDFSLPKASFVAIVGQNGSGKTTLSRCMSGYLMPTKGRTLIDGQEVRRLNVRSRAEVISYVFQNPDHQIFLDSVQRDVEFGPRNLGWSNLKINKRSEEILKMLGLWEMRDIHPYRLSKGGRQRLAIASVAVMEPKVLIVDEPTTGQDPYQARAIMDLLCHLRDELAMTIIVVTHAIDLVAEYCEKTVVLHEGKVLLEGSTQEVMTRSEILIRTRVQPPPITRLALDMNWFPPPLTVEEAITRLDQLVHPSSELG